MTGIFEHPRPAVVDNVWDGDSIHLTVDIGFNVDIAIKTRLLGADAPELSTPQGKVVRDWLRERVPEGTAVILRTFKYPGDKYGRWLAKIDAPGIGDVAEALIAAGLAVPYDGGARVSWHPD
jgi:micrococcal nuclease